MSDLIVICLVIGSLATVSASELVKRLPIPGLISTPGLNLLGCRHGNVHRCLTRKVWKGYMGLPYL
jgi:hypothetical protein